MACLALGVHRLGADMPTTHPTLTTAAQVRALTEDEARRAIPVHLRAIYIGEADPAGIAFVVQDKTEGIYVQGPANLVAGLTRGDLLEIDGVSDPGGFAPFVAAHMIRKIGRAPIPEPTEVALDELNAGQMDARWVEISGVVRSVAPTARSDTGPPPPGTRYASPAGVVSQARMRKVKMKLASGSARVIVEIDGSLKPEEYVDAEVRIRGLCFNLHNRNRQFVRPFVQVPRGVKVEVIKPPPPHPFGSPPRPVATLLQFQDLARTHGHRVHVRGVVIFDRPGAMLWIRDHGHSLRVETNEDEVLVPGDEVDVLGFPAPSGYSAVLQDAVFRKGSAQPPPMPQILTDMSSALRHDADLVQLEGRLTDLRRFPDSVDLTLNWHHTSIRALMHLPADAAVPADWLAGSLVRVSGVCTVRTDEPGPLGGLWEPHSFQLLLRSPSDLAVLQSPPWWNAERVIWILSGFLALALGAVATVMLVFWRRSKAQEHRREMAETEFAAILNERNRVAREIHDTLSQNLGAISVQLELARTHAADISAPARKHIGTAHQLARSALAEARDSIWNMRSHVLERCDLGEALEDILKRMTEGTGVTPSMQVTGARRRLPPVVENNLLRIGQEAITNASKHAKPSRIDVLLAFEDRSVRLSVEDDGVGFVRESKRNADRRSFGLMGIEERAEVLGGSVDIRSVPGHGTCVTVVIST